MKQNSVSIMWLPSTLLIISAFSHIRSNLVLPSNGKSQFILEINKITNKIISDRFYSFKCITYITDKRDDGLQVYSEKPVLLIYIAGNESDVSYQMTQSYEQACAGYIVRVEEKFRIPMIRMLLKSKNKATGSRYNNQRFVFLPKNETDVKTDVLNDKIMYFMPNTVVVVQRNPEAFDIVTHNIFNHYKYEIQKVKQEVVDVWAFRGGFKVGADLYPCKIKNIYGKKLTYALLHYSPFTLVLKEGNETIYDGFDTRIATEFVKKINGTWGAKDHPVDLWGHAFPNGSGDGILGSVMDNTADLGIAAMYQWFCEDTDCSFPMYQSLITCLVPRPKLVSGWLTIILSFTPDTWIALIIVYIFNTGFVLFLLISLKRMKGVMKYKKIGMMVSDAFFTVFRIQLEQIPRVPRTLRPLAIFLRICVGYYFFVASFWSGGIASILTVPRYEEPINTLQNLLDKWPKVKWGADSDVWILAVRDTIDPRLVEMIQKYVIQDPDTLVRRAKSLDFGYFIEQLPHGHYGFRPYINEESVRYLRLMEDYIYTAYGCVIFTKGSPYLETFDQFVHQMYDTGIIHKLEVQVFTDKIGNRVQNMITFGNEKEKESVILAIRHIEGPLYIYVVGMTTATLVFFGEKYIIKRK